MLVPKQIVASLPLVRQLTTCGAFMRGVCQ